MNCGRLIRLFGTFPLFALGASPLAGQFSGRLTGSVSDVATGNPIENAVVEVVSTSARLLTDATGSYEFEDVPLGNQQVRVTRIGYNPVVFTVNIQAGLISRRRVQLETSPVSLEGVTVEANVEGAEVREVVQSPFSVSVIPGPELAGRGLSLDEVLQRATGVQVRRSGGLGSASVFNVRGLEGRRVQIFIDGAAIDVDNDSFTLDDIPVQLIERVEVYKGVVPARLGGDGLGAAINVVTISPPGGYVDIGLTRGSYGHTQFASIFKANFKPIRTEVGFSLDYDHANNDYMMQSPFISGLNIKRDHDGFNRWLAGMGTTTTGTWFDEIKSEIAFIRSKRELQGIQANLQHAETRADVNVVAVEAEKLGALDGRLEFRVGGAVAHTAMALTDTSAFRYTFDGDRYPSPNGRGEIGLYPTDSRNKQDFYRQKLNGSYRLSQNHALNFNWVIEHSRFNPTDSVANEATGVNMSDYPGESTNATLGLSHEWRPFGERVVNIIGTRGYVFRSKGTPSTLYAGMTEMGDEVRNRTSALGFSEALRVRVTPTTLLKGSVAYARRLPSSSELFGDGILIQPSPALKPETSLNFNLGLQYDARAAGFRRIQFEANAFWMNVEDLIRLARGFANTASHQNIGKARIWGADAEIRADVTTWLYASGNVTYQDSRDVGELIPGTTVPNPTEGLRVPNMPWLFGNAAIELHRRDLFGGDQETSLFYEASFTEEYFYAFEVSQHQDRKIPRSFTHTLGLEQRLYRTGITMTVEVQNFTNERTMNQFNQPLPGRVFRVKMRYTRLGEQ